MDETGAIHSVLWTGGWDSTFRVLDLVINQKQTVQPLYLMDPQRASTPVEIRTTETIRARIAARFPGAEARILPLKTYKVTEVAADDAIDSAFARIRATYSIGSQYTWLARFCKEQGLREVELSIHKDDKAHAVLEKFVFRDADGNYRLQEQEPDSPLQTVFGYFSFPLFEMTKLGMEETAKRVGFLDILELSWFCHSPYKGEACGRCPPCRYTIEEGMGRRLSPAARYLRYPLRRLENLIKKYFSPTAVAALVRLKERISG